MTIRERVIYFLEYKSISKYRFYKETGISNGFLDKDGAIGSDKCAIICSHYHELNPEWLLLEKGKMLRSKYNNADIKAKFDIAAESTTPYIRKSKKK